MGFESIGNLAGYAKMKYAETKWSQKKSQLNVAGAKGGFVAGGGSLSWKRGADTPAVTGENAYGKFSLAGVDAESQARASRLGMIEGKLKAGAELSGTDLDYLKEHAPELYDKAVQVARERKQYEESLARCRTKDDVQRLATQRLSQFSSEAHAIRQSSMPREKKLEKMEFLNMRVNAVRGEHAAFVASPEYEKLPWQRELDEGKAREKEDRIKAEEKKEVLDFTEPAREEPKLPELGETAAEETAAGEAETAGTEETAGTNPRAKRKTPVTAHPAAQTHTQAYAPQQQAGPVAKGRAATATTPTVPTAAHRAAYAAHAQASPSASAGAGVKGGVREA